MKQTREKCLEKQKARTSAYIRQESRMFHALCALVLVAKDKWFITRYKMPIFGQIEFIMTR